jgi:hypothetical protein
MVQVCLENAMYLASGLVGMIGGSTSLDVLIENFPEKN